MPNIPNKNNIKSTKISAVKSDGPHPYIFTCQGLFQGLNRGNPRVYYTNPENPENREKSRKVPKK